MSRLNDIIAHAVEEARDDEGACEPHRAKAIAKPLLDDDDRDTLIDEGLFARLKKAAERGAGSAIQANAAVGQGALFPDLHRGYAIDTDGRKIKLTEALSRLEFNRIIAIRKKQIDDDRAHLRALEAALHAVSPLWDAHPDLTFGDICKLHAAKDSAAA